MKLREVWGKFGRVKLLGCNETVALWSSGWSYINVTSSWRRYDVIWRYDVTKHAISWNRTRNEFVLIYRLLDGLGGRSLAQNLHFWGWGIHLWTFQSRKCNIKWINLKFRVKIQSKFGLKPKNDLLIRELACRAVCNRSAPSFLTWNS